MKKSALVLLIPLLLLAYWFITPLFSVVTLDEAVPTANTDSKAPTEVAVKKAVVIGTPGHPASGSVRIIDVEGKKFLRYENFKTINGPDLFVYLATDINASDFVNLGKLKATDGNVNYEIPAGTSLEKYTHALVWCKAFGVLFNSAEIN